MHPLEDRRGDILISTDKTLLQFPRIQQMLAGSYWANQRPTALTERGVEHSLVFGMYHNSRQIGFARVITDQAIMAWLLDVIIDQDYRGRGLGTWLVGFIVAHPSLQGLSRFMLTTSDAHTLYEKFGFTTVTDPSILMEKKNG